MQSGLDLLGTPLKKKCDMLSTARWCGNDSTLSFSCHRKEKYNYCGFAILYRDCYSCTHWKISFWC